MKNKYYVFAEYPNDGGEMYGPFGMIPAAQWRADAVARAGGSYTIVYGRIVG